MSAVLREWAGSDSSASTLLLTCAVVACVPVLSCLWGQLRKKTLLIDKPLRVGIVGAGAIGTFAGLRMLKSSCVERVTLVGRESLKQALAESNNRITLRDNTTSPPKDELFQVGEGFDVAFGDVRTLENCDVIIVAVKTVATQAAGKELASCLSRNSTATIVSFQNGISNADLLRGIFATTHPSVQIASSTVAFAAEWLVDSATFTINFPGGCMIEKPRNSLPAQKRIAALVQALNDGNLASKCLDDIEPIKLAKLMVNLINPINALSGVPVPEMLAQKGYRRVLEAAILEAAAVLKSSGIRGGDSFAVRILGSVVPFLLRNIPDWAIVRIFPPNGSYKSSMLQDLERGRSSTEIDALCGEIVRLADSSEAPINKSLVDLIHKIEQSKEFLSSDELSSVLKLPTRTLPLSSQKSRGIPKSERSV